jgi:heterodisulfide reductase subunit B
MTYAFFLGCTVPVRSLNYELSARKIARAVGIELVDIDDFECCGYPTRNLDQGTALLLAARNLCLAEEYGYDICTLCSACAGTLADANRKLKENAELRQDVNEKLSETTGRFYRGTVEVKHFARILFQDVGLEKIRRHLDTDLSSLRLAAHYGCHYLKPSHIYDSIEDPENPHTLDDLIEVTGATSIIFEGRDRCCGGGVLAVDETVALAMAKEKLDRVIQVEGDALVLICPFCDIMYESNQRKIEKVFNTHYGLPVIYLPQLLGLAMGMIPDELGFRLNRIKTKDLLTKVTHNENA